MEESPHPMMQWDQTLILNNCAPMTKNITLPQTTHYWVRRKRIAIVLHPFTLVFLETLKSKEIDRPHYKTRVVVFWCFCFVYWTLTGFSYFDLRDIINERYNRYSYRIMIPEFGNWTIEGDVDAYSHTSDVLLFVFKSINTINFEVTLLTSLDDQETFDC